MEVQRSEKAIQTKVCKAESSVYGLMWLGQKDRRKGKPNESLGRKI